MRSIRGVRFLRYFGVNGMVLYPFVLYAEKDPGPVLMSHEAIHVAQIRRVGVIPFYRRYITEYFQGRLAGLNHHEAYRNISFEREAFTHQGREYFTQA